MHRNQRHACGVVEQNEHGRDWCRASYTGLFESIKMKIGTKSIGREVTALVPPPILLVVPTWIWGKHWFPETHCENHSCLELPWDWCWKKLYCVCLCIWDAAKCVERNCDFGYSVPSVFFQFLTPEWILAAGRATLGCILVYINSIKSEQVFPHFAITIFRVYVDWNHFQGISFSFEVY